MTISKFCPGQYLTNWTILFLPFLFFRRAHFRSTVPFPKHSGHLFFAKNILSAAHCGHSWGHTDGREQGLEKRFQGTTDILILGRSYFFWLFLLCNSIVCFVGTFPFPWQGNVFVYCWILPQKLELTWNVVLGSNRNIRALTFFLMFVLVLLKPSIAKIGM